MKNILYKYFTFFIAKERNKQHFLRKHYYNPIRQDAESIARIKQEPKLEWEKLFKQYILAPKNIYEIWGEEILKSDILTDTNDWFYLMWICLLLQKKEEEKAAWTLAQYVAGINGTIAKNIDTTKRGIV